MKKYYSFALLVCSFGILSNSVFAQNFYDPNTIQVIDIYFSQPDWDYRMDTAKAGSEGYLMADSVIINGVSFDSVGVKYKGNSSYNASYAKNPLRITLDKFKDHNYQDYQDIKLSNGYGDPSCVREVMAYQILKNYMHCPQSNFTKVNINGNYTGLYSSAEDINKKFLSEHFYSSNNTFLKCSPTGAPATSLKSNFKYNGVDIASYSPVYELKSDTGWNEFIQFCNTLTNNTVSVSSSLDVDRAIWMLAFNNLFANFDSYNGVYAQNHYTYKDQHGYFNSIIWDLNMCFGAFPYTGIGTIGTGFKTVPEIINYSPYAHETETSWPLINYVLSDSTLRRKYLAHYKTMMSEVIGGNQYAILAGQYQTLIDNSIQADTNKFFTYAQFQSGLTGNVVFGSFTVPGISNLLTARNIYLLGLPEFTAAEPNISTAVFSSSNPTYNSNVTISVNVTNANASSVYVGYRFDIRNKFSKLPLFDDGAHNDGASNDNVYGNNFIMAGADMQFYVYAENNTIGRFLPVRAEHEFFTLNAASVAPSAGDVVINEVLTDNVGGQKDEYNDTEDWIELFNNSNNVADLSNMYLSDKSGNLMKWRFPAGTKIVPNGFLIVWADDDSLQKILHTNFALDKDTSHVYLSNATNIFDSVTIVGLTSNNSFARMPNGTGSFVGTLSPTFNTYNYPAGVNSINSSSPWSVYPNPTSSLLHIKGLENELITLYNTLGQPVISSNTQVLNVSQLPKGIYYLRCKNWVEKILVY